MRIHSQRVGLSALRADLARTDCNTPFQLPWYYLTRPGVRAVVLYRLQNWLLSYSLMRLSWFVYAHNARSTGAEIMVGVRIGPGLVIVHPSGLVIGHGVVIGDHCTLLQQATLGERWTDGRSDGAYPRLGNNVTISVGATLLGGLVVGDDSTIGARAIVLSDVPQGSVIVGLHK